MGELTTSASLVIIGAGPGGYVAAIRAAQLGLDVTVIDKAELGGVCLNVGCIPSKALIHVSELVESIRFSKEIGITSSSPKLNIRTIKKWKEAVVSKLTGGVHQLFDHHNITYIRGTAQFESSHTLRIRGETSAQTLRFEHAIIATGSSPVDIKGFTPDAKQVWNSTHALQLQRIPKKLVVIGGGYIGLEMGCFYQKLGSQVTILERGEKILSYLDEEYSRPIHKRLEQLGCTILTQTSAQSLKKGKSLGLTISSGSTTKKLTCDVVLVAVGRKPNTANLGLEKTHVKVDEHGFILVDDQRRTQDSRIFAIGDVCGQPMLAHKASREAQVAAEVIAGQNSSFDNLVVPSVIYTDPELAVVGMDEAHAKEAGYEPVTGKFPFTALGRAITMNSPTGFVKLICDKKSGLVLGGVIVGHSASDLIGEITLAIEMGAVAEDLALTIHPHPTYGEAIQSAAEDVLHQCIHLVKSKPKPSSQFTSSPKPVTHSDVSLTEVEVEKPAPKKKRRSSTPKRKTTKKSSRSRPIKKTKKKRLIRR